MAPRLIILCAALAVSSLFLSTPAFVIAEEVASATAVGKDGSAIFTEEQQLKLEGAREKFEFQAEVSRLMDIIINSLYTKVEIFLRELISNASDAIDKIRFLALSDAAALAGAEDLEIRISGDKAARTLTIRDTGVGMTKTDLINYLGTVARSGTASLMEKIASGGDMNLIGQFGVGFYSVYLVADRVRVVTKNNDDTQYVWESAADGTYSVAEDPRGNTLGRGTEITLFLKDDATQYAETSELRALIKRYSEFITFPIYLRSVSTEEIEVPIEESEEDATPTPSPEVDADGEVVAAEEGEEGEEKEAKPKTRKETKETVTWDLVNDNKAIWSRSPSSIEDNEYRAFFKQSVKDHTDPMTWIHFKGEGDVEFRSILYTPGTPPSDLYDNYYAKNAHLRLYVRKVLISDEFEDLLPRYLNFIRGVVDSDDLPLNVSREQLQQAKILKVIAKKLVRKALEMVRRLAQSEKKAIADKNKGDGEDDEAPAAEGSEGEEGSSKSFEIPSHLAGDTALTAYSKFWEAYGKNIKLGVIEDIPNKSKLAKLLRFKSSKSIAAHKADPLSTSVWRSLEDYVADMAEGQRQIYFIAGESIEQVESSPFIERLTSAGLEVLYMTDPIDEYTVSSLSEFEGHRMQSITKEGLQLPSDVAGSAKALEAAYKATHKPLTDYLKKVYGDKVEKVAVSARLAREPCVLVTSQFGYSANMERIMRAQAFADPSKQQFMISRKTMEINPRHPIFGELKARVGDGATEPDETTVDIAHLLYETALLNSGFAMDDPKAFAARMYRVMGKGLSLTSLDLLPEIDLPAEEPEYEDESEDATAAAEAAATLNAMGAEEL